MKSQADQYFKSSKFDQFQKLKILAYWKRYFGHFFIVFLALFWLWSLRKALKLRNLSNFVFLKGSGTSYLQKTVFSDNPGLKVLENYKNHTKITNFQKKLIPVFELCLKSVRKIWVSFKRLGTRLPFGQFEQFDFNFLIS